MSETVIFGCSPEAIGEFVREYDRRSAVWPPTPESIRAAFDHGWTTSAEPFRCEHWTPAHLCRCRLGRGHLGGHEVRWESTGVASRPPQTQTTSPEELMAEGARRERARIARAFEELVREEGA